MATIANLVALLTLNDDLTSSLEKAQSKVQKIGAGMTSVGRSLSVGLTAPLVGFGVLAFKAGLDFEAGMANVNSIAQLTTAQLADLSDQVLELAQNPGITQTPKELAEGLYNVYSSGFQGAEGLTVLNSAAIAATAGLSTTDVAVRAITGVLNAFNLEASESQRISDLLFTTVNLGQITFEELANNVGSTIPLAASLGVALEDVFAAYAQLTSKSVLPSQAETSIANLMRTALNPTTNLTAAVEAQGYANAQTALSTLGLAGYVKLMEDYAADANLTLFDLIGNTEGVTAAQLIGGENTADYAKNLDAMNHASEGVGATQTALAKQMESLQFKIDKAKQSFAILGVTLFGIVAPAMTVIADKVTALLLAINKLPKSVQTVLVIFGALLAALGPVLIVLGSLVGAISAVGTAFGAGGALAGLTALLGPIALIVAALVLLGVAYKTNLFGFADAVNAIAGKIADAFGWISDKVSTFADTFSSQLDITSKIPGYDRITEIFRALGFAITELTGLQVVDFFTELGKSIQRPINAVKKFVNAWKDIVKAVMSGDISGVIDGIKEQFAAFGDFLAAPAKSIGKLLQTISTGFAPLDNVIHRIGGLIVSFGRLIQEVFQGDIGGAFDILKRMFSQIGGIASAAVDLLKAAFSAIDWGQLFAKMGDIASVLWQWLSGAISGIDWAGLWDGVTEQASYIVGKLGDIAYEVKKWVTDAVGAIDWTALWDNVTDVTETIVDKLGALSLAITTWVVTAVGDINWGSLWGGVTDVTATIVGKLGGLSLALATWVVTAVGDLNWAGLWDGVTDITGTIVGKLGNLKDAIGTWITDATSDLPSLDTLSKVLDPAVVGLTTAYGTIVAVFSSIGERISTVLSLFDDIDFSALDSIGTAFDGVVGPLSTAYGTIVSLFSSIGERIGTLVSTFTDIDFSALDSIGTAFDAIVTPLSTAYGTIMAVFGTIKTGIETAISTVSDIDFSALDGLGKVLDPVSEGLTLAWAGISGAFTLVTDTVTGAGALLDTAFSGLKSALDTIWGVISPIIDTISEGLGKLSALSIPSWVPGFGGGDSGSQPTTAEITIHFNTIDAESKIQLIDAAIKAYSNHTYTATLLLDALNVFSVNSNAVQVGEDFEAKEWAGKLTFDNALANVKYSDTYGWGDVIAATTWTGTLNFDNGPASIAYSDAFSWGDLIAATTWTGTLDFNNGPAAVAYTEAYGWGDTFASQTFQASLTFDLTGLYTALSEAQRITTEIGRLLPNSPAKEGGLSFMPSFQHIADALDRGMGGMPAQARAIMGEVGASLHAPGLFPNASIGGGVGIQGMQSGAGDLNNYGTLIIESNDPEGLIDEVRAQRNGQARH